MMSRRMIYDVTPLHLTNIRSRALGLPQSDMPPALVPVSIAEILKNSAKK
jgi:hypothetical protein